MSSRQNLERPSKQVQFECRREILVFGAHQATDQLRPPLVSLLRPQNLVGEPLQVGRLGQQECLVDIQRYDFNWPRTYFFETPVTLPTSDDLRLRCVYNTTSRTTTTRWGDGTQDEMCVGIMYTAPAR